MPPVSRSRTPRPDAAVPDVPPGGRRPLDDVFSLAYEELRRLAAHRLAQERPGDTLQPTALVHEAYLRLIGDADVQWNGRGHFFGAAAQAMRRILISHAREKQAQKCGGGVPVTLNEDLAFAADRSFDVIEIDEALEKLAQIDPRQAQVVELRFFSGLSVEGTKLALYTASGFAASVGFASVFGAEVGLAGAAGPQAVATRPRAASFRTTPIRRNGHG